MRNFDIKTFLLMLAAGLAGAGWAYFNLQAAGSDRGPAVLTPLVWAVFAIPFFTFLGWLIARPGERWRALGACLAVYLLTIFVAARIEHLMLGRAQAQQTGHSFYFNAVITLQLLAAIGLAVQRAGMLDNRPPRES